MLRLHMQTPAEGDDELTGDDLLRVLGALDNPHRLRILAALAHGRFYVSELARQLGISRPLLQVHLRRLEAVGLVSATVELDADGRAMKYYEVSPFVIRLDPRVVAAAVRTLTLPARDAAEPEYEKPARRRRVKEGPDGLL
ncbi:ArsR/SmtB family transcription factor [Micromonospora sp. HM5-17]|uniref:ArsR/SmtB family transcription factor n=1 Tax=Micromonospora sp. HM5-17 TaxID=2487710 RepID=UPI0026BE6C60